MSKTIKSNRKIELLRFLFDVEYEVLLEDDKLEDFKNLILDIDPLFLAKASLYVRINIGYKLLPFYISVLISNRISGKIWAKDYYERIIIEPDDMINILRKFDNLNYKIPNALKKGFNKAFNKFDNNQLLLSHTSIKKVIKIIHPKSTNANEKALTYLMKNNFSEFNRIKTKEFMDYLEQDDTTIDFINKVTL